LTVIKATIIKNEHFKTLNASKKSKKSKNKMADLPRCFTVVIKQFKKEY
jgi:hypothetical protein